MILLFYDKDFFRRVEDVLDTATYSSALLLLSKENYVTLGWHATCIEKAHRERENLQNIL